MSQDQSDQLTSLIGKLALSKKAEKVISIDVRELTSITDFFLICSANTEIQVKAIADAIRRGTPHKPLRLEGYENQRWILLDYVDVIAHIFKTNERNYYNLDKLWADAPLYKIVDDDKKISDSILT